MAGMECLTFAKAYALYSQDSEHAPPEVKRLVMQVMAASVLARSEGR